MPKPSTRIPPNPEVEEVQESLAGLMEVGLAPLVEVGMMSSDISLLHRAIGYFRDPQVALWRKLSALVALAYTAWPLDVIPDVPLVGWLDDLGVVGAAVWFLLRDIRKYAPPSRQPARSVGT